MASKIDTVSAREKLEPRRAPYWQRIAKGRFVGYRRMTPDTAGTWLARYRDEASNRQLSHAMGTLDAHPPNERFDRACTLARNWFDHVSQGGASERTTVRQAAAAYVAHLRREKGGKAANDTEARFRRWLDDDPIARIELAKLTRQHVQALRERLMAAPAVVGGVERPKAKDTINRDLTALRAALNRALADGKVTTDFAWREALKPIKNASRRRELYLDREQRRALIQHAQDDVGHFLRGLALLPLRPGALAALTVGHFDKRLNTLRIGADKSGRDRKIVLPPATAAFFAEQAKGKLPAAPLLARADGMAWNKDSWKGPIKEAAAAAGLPEATTAYALRHSTITDLVTGGLDLLTVAQISGTSVAMIERHYGALRSDVAASALAKLAL
ncbi:tyrosine-type recombinase/integrase [Cupriavidus gilardii]|uniref:tyrosine-type recombinase/integrase n=1 Tax=Cupriavidus gilardii TaxID=82541 RepID=UPI0021B180A2|nr:tyrosine-type recombinase/integrase [Cupriavidus gilardii]UXC37098.1 tyrosine-type recombinase/integrase [Cupriavidus gilardii]